MERGGREEGTPTCVRVTSKGVGVVTEPDGGEGFRSEKLQLSTRVPSDGGRKVTPLNKVRVNTLKSIYKEKNIKEMHTTEYILSISLFVTK